MQNDHISGYMCLQVMRALIYKLHQLPGCSVCDIRSSFIKVKPATTPYDALIVLHNVLHLATRATKRALAGRIVLAGDCTRVLAMAKGGMGDSHCRGSYVELIILWSC